MGHEELQEYIDQLIGGSQKRRIVTREISDMVDVAKVWPDKPNGNGLYLSCTVFFIKDTARTCVGAVLDMNFDLQWYVVKEYRGEGHLTRALKEVILPFIFSDSRKHKRDRQEITIDGDFYKESRRVAESVGFKPIDMSTRTPTEFESTTPGQAHGVWSGV
jgi:hypothetical protein